MNLIDILDKAISDNEKEIPPQEIINRIEFLRIFLSIHSYLYYHMGDSIISDQIWDGKAYELVDLQKKYGYDVPGIYDKEFKDFDGSTGMHLPKDQYIVWKSLQLLRTHDSIENQKFYM